MRQERLKALLQAETAVFMMNLRQDMEISELIGVDDVLMTSDLKQATVWISFTPQPTEGRAKVLWSHLQKALPKLKSWLAERLEIRQIPQIVLEFSNPEEEYKLDRIFDELT
ncbi:MAG: ribosome-binding factor A [Patescibacteria group bacterium]|nr:ribosome-binding factor A [Patescibacteria group bacterium]